MATGRPSLCLPFSRLLVALLLLAQSLPSSARPGLSTMAKQNTNQQPLPLLVNDSYLETQKRLRVYERRMRVGRGIGPRTPSKKSSAIRLLPKATSTVHMRSVLLLVFCFSVLAFP